VLSGSRHDTDGVMGYRCQVWVPGRTGALQREEDLECPVGDSGVGTGQQSAQAARHHCRGRRRWSSLDARA